MRQVFWDILGDGIKDVVNLFVWYSSLLPLSTIYVLLFCERGLIPLSHNYYIGGIFVTGVIWVVIMTKFVSKYRVWK